MAISKAASPPDHAVVLPPDLYDALSALARHQDRSLTGLVVSLLNAGLDRCLRRGC
jgi:hypothetical protein